jgi:hypothetical protein
MLTLTPPAPYTVRLRVAAELIAYEAKARMTKSPLAMSQQRPVLIRVRSESLQYVSWSTAHGISI